MKLNELQPNKGATKNPTRVGRGIGSGKGKTSGSGQKGQKARSGVAINGFEGGQMPLYRRMPKMGFNNIFRRHLAELSLGKLQEAIDAKKLDAGKPVNEETLVKAGVVRRKLDGIKLLANGTLKDKIELNISGASKAAVAAVEKAGGKVSIVKKNVAPVGEKKNKTKPEKRPTKKKGPS